ncbi:uncharacterized protein LOC129597250 [Paramacrobiotus metropolitanus]|uniref:uncharacterized protein LOC129597250 n=1 Tax=Paramacrobiotus metropolitanus TaxID=2943436 RepID=UPI002445A814|nr:uncharacterized protein LOC129597250 [Paramacrobiotus metropolitanus]
MQCCSCTPSIPVHQPPPGYQIHPAVFCLDLELGPRLGGRPKTIFHLFYDAITKCAQFPDPRCSPVVPLIRQTNWILLNWKSLASCEQILISDDFQQSLAKTTDCVIVVAEGVAYVTDTVRHAVRAFLRHKFMEHKPVLFLFANRMVETLSPRFRQKVDESLKDLAVDVILGESRQNSGLVMAKGCRMMTVVTVDKDVQDAIRRLWMLSGTSGPKTVEPCHCSLEWDSPSPHRIPKVTRKRGKTFRKVRSAEFVQDGLYPNLHSVSLSDVALKLAEIHHPEFSESVSFRNVLLLPANGEKTDANRYCASLQATQDDLRKVIRKNVALQEYLCIKEKELEMLRADCEAKWNDMKGAFPPAVLQKIVHTLKAPSVVA